MLKKSIQLVISIVGAAVLVGCDGKPIVGEINVKEAFSYNEAPTSCLNSDHSSQPCTRPEEAIIQPGKYSVSLRQSGKNTVKVEIKNKTKTHKFELKTNDKKMPLDGEFNLTSGVSGQPFDFTSKINSENSESPEYSGENSCVVEEYGGRDCYIESRLSDGSIVEVCAIRKLIYHGEEQERYYYATTTTGLTGKVSLGAKIIADITAERNVSKKIVTYSSGCHSLSYVRTETSTEKRTIRP